ncbi:MAG: acetyl-CoA C-acyltransferase [Deltaproteobacteria bacterium]|nr:acetyl-CoA C-acyltransferase [Deltaproteobacteria bacterium]MBK9647082.1 acetyl-CoA C-acyltransferase [Deltaproteobacteria bacterium]
MTDALIFDAVRTPIGAFGGALSDVRPDDLAAHTIRALLDRAGVDGGEVEEVFLGNANQAGEDNRNVARMAALLAGLPQSVPGVTVNRLCASGLEALSQASRAIAVGDLGLAVAGGVESMSRAPYVIPRGNTAPKFGNLTAFDTSLGWRFPNPKMEQLFPLEPMGATAENLAEQHQISRADQDAFAFASHQKALRAQDEGWFQGELVAVPIPQRKGPPVMVTTDEGPRRDTSLDRLAKLGAAFRAGGTVTAGNSSTLNDGAAAILVGSAAAGARLGLTPRFRVVARASAGVDPRIMGIGPVPAVTRALERAGWTVADLDAVELNEAFAAQSLAVIRALGLDESRVNQHGGAIALGHPLGCSGARIIATLMGVLDRTGGRRGLATLCVGVGQGLAVLIERVG